MPSAGRPRESAASQTLFSGAGTSLLYHCFGECLACGVCPAPAAWYASPAHRAIACMWMARSVRRGVAAVTIQCK